jgi:hypothetical protein
VSKAIKEIQEAPDPLVPKAVAEQLEIKDQRVLKVLLVLKEAQEHKVQQDHKEALEAQARKAFKE